MLAWLLSFELSERFLNLTDVQMSYSGELENWSYRPVVEEYSATLRSIVETSAGFGEMAVDFVVGPGYGCDC